MAVVMTFCIYGLSIMFCYLSFVNCLVKFLGHVVLQFCFEWVKGRLVKPKRDAFGISVFVLCLHWLFTTAHFLVNNAKQKICNRLGKCKCILKSKWAKGYVLAVFLVVQIEHLLGNACILFNFNLKINNN